jgi:hypothetical protein
MEIGDTVKRHINIYNQKSSWKIGIIIDKYSEPQTKCSETILGPYPELYKVRWNNGEIEKGFLPHGLIKIVLN